MIKLSDFDSRIINGIDESIQKYLGQHGSFSALGIYSCPWSGWVSICFNRTKTISDAEENCPDFEDVEYGMIEIEEWSNEYNSDKSIIEYNNKTHELEIEEVGDDGYNVYFFKYLIDIVNTKYGIKYKNKILIQMLDSEYFEII